MDSRSRFYELSWDAMEWLAANRWRGRLLIAATILLAPLVIAAFMGSSMVFALKLASLQGVVLLLFFSLRDAGLI